MKDKSGESIETIILGSGPAGLTAAIYAARNRCCPLVIQGAIPGGQLTTTTLVDNFPGFPQSIEGGKLMEEMERQARRFGARFVAGEVSRVDLGTHPFQVWLEEDLYRCLTLVVATGASPRMLGLPNERELYGRGISVCATCDGFFFKDREVLVVGGGDTALEEAAFLARMARKVTVVHRRDRFRAIPELQQRAKKIPRVDFRMNTVIESLQGDRQTGFRGARLKNLATGQLEDLACDGMFLAIGHTPNTELFKGQLDMDGDGFLVTREGTLTSRPGVFAAGDVQDRLFRQAVTAAGSGCMAAMQAERFLEANFTKA